MNTFKVRRWAGTTSDPEVDRFDDPNGKLTVYTTSEFCGYEELQVTIVPVIPFEERAREAQIDGLVKALVNLPGNFDDHAHNREFARHLLDVIAHANAEFLKRESGKD